MVEEEKQGEEGLAGQDEKDDAEYDAEFDAERMKEKVRMLEMSDEIREGLKLTEEMLVELKGDLKGGWHIVDRLLKKVPRDRREVLIKQIVEYVIGRHENHRRLKEQYGETWKHPFHASVNTEYYRCGNCGGRLGAEMIVVIERRRDGDKILTFCGRACVANHEWTWDVDA